MNPRPLDTCDVCGRAAPAGTHPCRFAKGCTCWSGKPCDGMTRAERRAAKKTEA